MMGHFYQAVRAGKMPAAGARRFAAFDDGADVMYIIEAIVKKPSAAALGQRRTLSAGGAQDYFTPR